MEDKLNVGHVTCIEETIQKSSRKTLIDSGQLRSFSIDCGMILKCILQQIWSNDVVCIYPARKEWL